MERLRERRVDAVVTDKETASILKPWISPRASASVLDVKIDEYYPSVNKDDVQGSLDVGTHAGRRAANHSRFHPRLELRRHGLFLIFASGFEVSSDLQRRRGIATIEGRDGRSLYDHWAHEFRTLHGMMTNGFPDQFFMGFFQGGFNASTTKTFNNQGRHIAWIINHALGQGDCTAEPSLEAQDAYVNHIREKQLSIPLHSFGSAPPATSTMTGRKLRMTKVSYDPEPTPARHMA